MAITVSVDVAARELAARPGYAELFRALHDRLARVGGEPRTVTLDDLSPPARQALGEILGRARVPGPRVTVRVADVDAALSSSRVGAGLRATLEATVGPIEDRPATRAADRAAWDRLWAELRARADDDRPLTEAWLERLRATGLLRRLGGDRQTCGELGRRALAVVRDLPAEARPLAELAGSATGDPHALDPGMALTTLVLTWAAMATGRERVPSAAAERRRLWAEVGVVCDPLSTSVLVLGLRLAGDGALARTLELNADAGEPVRVTLRQLATGDLHPRAAGVRVCENPSVIAAAAERVRAVATPLVCVDGVPDAAAATLLAELAAAGTDLAFHGDFDWGGIRIGNLVARRYGTRPWRFTAADYAAAVARTPVTVPLSGRPVTASWDPELAGVMRASGRVIAEEQVLDDLLADLVG